MVCDRFICFRTQPMDVGNRSRDTVRASVKARQQPAVRSGTLARCGFLVKDGLQDSQCIAL
jgi:hypothetical protein